MGDPLEPFTEHADTGTVLFREGEAGTKMYVIQSGTVEISRMLYDETRVLAVLSAGEFFGEMAIVNNRPRSATATVRDPGKLLVIDTLTFESMLQNQTEIGIRIIKSLATRLESANRQLELLLLKDENHRIVQCLQQLAAQRMSATKNQNIYVPIDAETLAERVAIERPDVETLLQRLSEAKLVISADKAQYSEPGYIVPDPVRLNEFLEFLELKDRFNSQL